MAPPFIFTSGYYILLSKILSIKVIYAVLATNNPDP